MEIHLCSLRGFVPQPKGDHRPIHTVLKKVHGCGVSTDVRGYSLPSERGAGLGGKMGVLGDATLDRIAAKSMVTHAGEDRISRHTVTFA
jgi:hypothetical protein